MRNIEIKTPLDDRSAVEKRLADLGGSRQWERRQRDTFFDVPPQRGWLKLREEEGRPAELIAYSRSSAESGPRASDYEVAPLDDAARWRRLLGQALAVRGVVDKRRTLWLLRHTRVHLDEVEGLGEFLELETLAGEIGEAAARREAEEIIAALGLERARFLAVPYLELLGENRA
jgi:predicted adenylyl cyclase CyaB